MKKRFFALFMAALLLLALVPAGSVSAQEDSPTLDREYSFQLKKGYNYIGIDNFPEGAVCEWTLTGGYAHFQNGKTTLTGTQSYCYIRSDKAGTSGLACKVTAADGKIYDIYATVIYTGNTAFKYIKLNGDEASANSLKYHHKAVLSNAAKMKLNVKLKSGWTLKSIDVSRLNDWDGEETAGTLQNNRMFNTGKVVTAITIRAHNKTKDEDSSFMLVVYRYKKTKISVGRLKASTSLVMDIHAMNGGEEEDEGQVFTYQKGNKVTGDLQFTDAKTLYKELVAAVGRTYVKMSGKNITVATLAVTPTTFRWQDGGRGCKVK